VDVDRLPWALQFALRVTESFPNSDWQW